MYLVEDISWQGAIRYQAFFVNIEAVGGKACSVFAVIQCIGIGPVLRNSIGEFADGKKIMWATDGKSEYPTGSTKSSDVLLDCADGRSTSSGSPTMLPIRTVKKGRRIFNDEWGILWSRVVHVSTGRRKL